jgi:hypothetical protein
LGKLGKTGREGILLCDEPRHVHHSQLRIRRAMSLHISLYLTSCE